MEWVQKKNHPISPSVLREIVKLVMLHEVKFLFLKFTFIKGLCSLSKNTHSSAEGGLCLHPSALCKRNANDNRVIMTNKSSHKDCYTPTRRLQQFVYIKRCITFIHVRISCQGG
ncbi:hypothetical protein ZWY2020_046372 [Hordeum vulgare]|nr:hypothetical protein ZWY2020_046372 [Hordeum vulgare]